jgi:hypothetical protein
MGLDMYIQDDDGNEVAYWRKFNALHKWFVDNVQDGIDECQRSRRLTKDDFENVLYVLKAIRKNPKTAPEMMPTSSGFFFGDTTYDNYFMEDVKHAIKTFELLCERVERDNLYYQSSW